jgi:hypothetical protein
LSRSSASRLPLGRNRPFLPRLSPLPGSNRAEYSDCAVLTHCEGVSGKRREGVKGKVRLLRGWEVEARCFLLSSSEMASSRHSSNTHRLAMFPPSATPLQYLSKQRVQQSRDSLHTFETAQAFLKGKGKAAASSGDDRQSRPSSSAGHELALAESKAYTDSSYFSLTEWDVVEQLAVASLDLGRLYQAHVRRPFLPSRPSPRPHFVSPSSLFRLSSHHTGIYQPAHQAFPQLATLLRPRGHAPRSTRARGGGEGVLREDACPR